MKLKWQEESRAVSDLLMPVGMVWCMERSSKNQGKRELKLKEAAGFSPGSSEVKITCFHCRGCGLNPSLGAKIPHVALCGQKNWKQKTKSNQVSIFPLVCLLEYNLDQWFSSVAHRSLYQYYLEPLEMQILRLSPRPIWFRTSGGEAQQSVLSGPPENSDVSSSLRTLSSNMYKNCR